MQTVPGTLMSTEQYTITPEQVAALNTLPPGLYHVCSRCRVFQPASRTLYFEGTDMLCEMCRKGVKV